MKGIISEGSRCIQGGYDYGNHQPRRAAAGCRPGRAEAGPCRRGSGDAVPPPCAGGSERWQRSPRLGAYILAEQGHCHASREAGPPPCLNF
jgi:hypothetical protein